MSIKFLVLGGGGYFGLGGGGECRLYFYGRGDLSDISPGNLGGGESSKVAYFTMLSSVCFLSFGPSLVVMNTVTVKTSVTGASSVLIFHRVING